MEKIQRETAGVARRFSIKNEKQYFLELNSNAALERGREAN